SFSAWYMGYATRVDQVWRNHVAPCGGPSGQPLTHLRHSRLALPLVRQRPASEDHGTSQHWGKPLVARERHGHLCLLLYCLPLAAQLMEHRRKGMGIREAGRMSELMGQGERFLVLLQGLIRIAERPQETSGMREAA